MGSLGCNINAIFREVSVACHIPISPTTFLVYPICSYNIKARTEKKNTAKLLKRHAAQYMEGKNREKKICVVLNVDSVWLFEVIQPPINHLLLFSHPQ